MMYDYLETMKENVLEHINENYSREDITEQLQERDNWEQELYDDLFCNDSVTGNASGSYTFNSYKAKEYVTDNGELLKEALEGFCVEAEDITEHFLNGDWEYFDVTIRCYLLSQAIDETLDELEGESE